MENLKELLRKFYNGGIYKATGEKGVAYINHRPSFEEMYEALNKSDVISSLSESEECKCIRFVGGDKYYSNGCKIHPNG